MGVELLEVATILPLQLMTGDAQQDRDGLGALVAHHDRSGVRVTLLSLRHFAAPFFSRQDGLRGYRQVLRRADVSLNC